MSAFRFRRIMIAGAFALAVAALLALLHWEFHASYIFYAGLYDGRAIAFLYCLACVAILAVAIAFARDDMMPLPRLGMVLAIAFFGALALVTAKLILLAFMNSADEYAFMFQSQTYEAMRLWNPVPLLGQALASDYAWVGAGKWAGQYPPGWPLLLALANIAFIPVWAVNALIGSVAIAATVTIVRREAGAGPALLTAAFFALSPFTIFTAASLHSHMLAATLILMATLAGQRMIATHSPAWALASGASIGYLGLSRYIAAPVIFAVLAVALLWGQGKRKPILLLGIAAGGAPFFMGLLLYHAAITGNPLKPAYWLSGRTLDHLYFDLPSIQAGFGLTRDRILELSLWTAPWILPLWLGALWIKRRAGALSFYDFVFPLLVLVFLFYPFDGGNRFGPRYYFDAWPLIAATIGTALPHCELRVRPIVRWAMGLAIIYGIVTWSALAFLYHRIVVERMDIYARVAELHLERAVIFPKSETGLMLPMTCDDLARNDIDAKASVLYARCDLTTPEALVTAFPDRNVWIYSREPGVARGMLTKFGG